MNVGDIVILDAVQIKGFVCNKGFKCKFKSQNGLFYKCLVNADEVNPSYIDFELYQILEVYDKYTNELVYKHDIKSGV